MAPPSHSGGNGSCVEVARNLRDVVAVRDSTDRGGVALIFTRGQWRRFACRLKAGESGGA